MASIVEELRKKIKEQGGDASDVHTIKQGGYQKIRYRWK